MEIEEKIKEDVKRSIETKKKDAISPSLVNKWLFSFAPELKGKMRLSIMLACFGESLKFTSYFFAAYVATAACKRKKIDNLRVMPGNKRSNPSGALGCCFKIICNKKGFLIT